MKGKDSSWSYWNPCIPYTDKSTNGSWMWHRYTEHQNFCVNKNNNAVENDPKPGMLNYTKQTFENTNIACQKEFNFSSKVQKCPGRALEK